MAACAAVARRYRAGLFSPSSSGRERQLDAERRSPAYLRSKVYRTVVKLYNSERASQSYSAPAWTRCEKELKNFLPVFQRDSLAGVGYGNLRHLAAPAQHQTQLASVGHGLQCVQHQVE